LEETPVYLKTTVMDEAINLSDYSVALGRRFRALKLWFALRSYGKEGLARILREQIRIANDLADVIRRDPDFELAAPVEFSLVCFRKKGSDESNRELLNQINASGHAFLTGTTLNGKFVLRLAIGNVAVTAEDVATTWAMIRS